MKSLSCISLPRPKEQSQSQVHEHHDSIDSYKDGSKATVLGHKGPKMQTIIEVLRCEFARPARSTSKPGGDGLGPSKQWSPIQYAAYYNREAALLHFLRAGQSPDGNAGEGNSTLLIAVTAGHIGIVKILCAAGADIRAATETEGETAIHLAIKSGRSDMLDVLLSYQPNLEARTLHTQETPLHYAAARPGYLATVVTLIKHGASYEALDSKGRSPAEVGIQNGNIPAAVAMVNKARGHRRQLTREKEMLLRHVEKAQNRFSMNNELIADIFEAGCEPGSTVLIEAIKRNDVALAQMFLEKGADPNRSTATGMRPIFAALNCCGAQMIQLLVKHGVDATAKDTEGLTVLQAALESPSAHDKEAISGIFDALLSSKADSKVIYPDGKTLIHHVVGPSLGLARIVKQLIENGVKVNRRDDSGSTALHYAGQSKACTEVLLKHGAKASLANDDGLTPLLSALLRATTENEPDLEPLIKASDLGIADRRQRTAAHIAAERGLEKTIKTLLKYRVDTTLIDSKNRTPLLLAVLKQQWSVVPALATQPGINSWDENGMTALHHIVTSIPKSPATWKDIASATAKFCERGVSRSMRDRSGATPLILAVKNLPEDGIPVVEVLLAEKGPTRNNCVGHEDHKGRSALHFAATMEKPLFVQALLRSGAPFALKEWKVSKGPIQPTTPAHKRTLKIMAEQEWIRRARMLRRSSGSSTTTNAVSKILHPRDMGELLFMGLDPNNLPTASRADVQRSLLWTILDQTLIQPPLPPQYLNEMLKLVFEHGADANALSTPFTKNDSKENLHKLTRHPLTFLLEEYPTLDIFLVTLLLDSKTNLTTASTAYGGRFPLHSAVKANRADIIELFLSLSADVNIFDAKKHTPLVIAAENGSWETVDLLLKHKARVDCKDAESNTLLHVAASRGSAKIVSSLLRAGARASVKNDKGEMPLSCLPENLEESEKEKIIKMLKYAEAQEQKDVELRKRKLEEDAAREGKERLRREREQAQRAEASRRPTLPSSISHLITPSITPAETKRLTKKNPASPAVAQATQPPVLKSAPNT